MARMKVTLLKADRSAVIIDGHEQSHVYSEGEDGFAEGDCPACEAARHTEGGSVLFFRVEDLDGDHKGRIRNYRTERLSMLLPLRSFFCAFATDEDFDTAKRGASR
jgi:hypothetical protein